MTEEVKVTEEKECKCFCKSEGFRKFLTIALGTFVGFYCALSLFAALHRPPMMPPHAFGPHGMKYGCPVQMMHQHHHFKGDRAKFERPERPAPFAGKIENND